MGIQEIYDSAEEKIKEIVSRDNLFGAIMTLVFGLGYWVGAALLFLIGYGFLVLLIWLIFKLLGDSSLLPFFEFYKSMIR